MSTLPSIESIDIGQSSFGCVVYRYGDYPNYKYYCMGGASSFILRGKLTEWYDNKIFLNFSLLEWVMERSEWLLHLKYLTSLRFSPLKLVQTASAGIINTEIDGKEEHHHSR